MIKIKRVYEKAKKEDGLRVLVDRLWPRGIRKEDAGIDCWLKDIAPSQELRTWFSHKPGKWPKFKQLYFQELGAREDFLAQIIARARKGSVTLLYGAKDERFNNAVALRAYLERKGGKRWA